MAEETDVGGRAPRVDSGMALEPAPQGAVSGETCYLCASSGQILYSGLTDYRLGQGSYRIVRCSSSSCRLLWLSPFPPEADLQRSYRSYYTHADSDHHSWLRRFHDNILAVHATSRYGYRPHPSPPKRALLRMAAVLYPGGPQEMGRSVMYLRAPTRSSLLVDVGCGNGEFLFRMMTLGWQVMGMDTDPSAVLQAQRKGVAARVGDLASCKLPDAYADAITMSHVIEHVSDPFSLLRECLRVLKPGGTLSLVTPNAASLAARIFGASWFALDVPRHLMLFRIATLRSTATAAGFAVETLTSSVTGARSVWTQSLRLRRRHYLGPMGRSTLASFAGGLPFQLLERILVASGRELGEELILQARRPGPMA